MFRLPVVDGAGRTSDELCDQLIEHLRAAPIDGAVVGQVVTGVSRDLWSLVDVARVKAAAGASLHYEITVKYPSAGDAGMSAERGSVEAFADLIAQAVAAKVPEDYRAAVVERARSLVGADERPASVGEPAVPVATPDVTEGATA
jgi:hypothetical protein